LPSEKAADEQELFADDSRRTRRRVASKKYGSARNKWSLISDAMKTIVAMVQRGRWRYGVVFALSGWSGAGSRPSGFERQR
jgi:hypothetical protein